MAKEKVRKSDEIIEKNNNLLYEIIGLFMIGFSIVIWEKLGNVGYWMSHLLKIVFGNWSFILIIYLFSFGIRALFFQKLIDFKSARINGFILLMISLMLLSNSTFYEYSLRMNDNFLLGAWEICSIYLSDPKTKINLGGGLLGSIIYQALIFLVGKIGTMIISIMLFCMSIILISNNNLDTFFSFLKKSFFKIMDFFHFIFGYIKGIKPKEKKQHLRRKVNINMLSDKEESINHTIQEKINEDLKIACIRVLSILNIVYSFSSINSGYQSSRLTFIVSEKIDVKGFTAELKRRIEGKILVLLEDNLLIIEQNNRFKDLLPLKKLLLETDGVPLMLEIDESPYSFSFNKHEHMLVSGSYESGIKTFIKGFIASLIFKNILFRLCVFDADNGFSELRGNKYLFYPYQAKEILPLLDHLSFEIDKRLELFKYLSVNEIEEANIELEKREVSNERMYHIFFVLNMFNKNFQDKDLESKILYLAQMGAKCGIHIIFISRDEFRTSEMLKKAFPLKILFHCDKISHSFDILGTDEGLYLEKKGDVIINFEKTRKRGQTGFISNMEYLKVINS